jgi:hypothetical protein
MTPELELERLVDAIFELSDPYCPQVCMNAAVAMVVRELVKHPGNHELMDRALSNFAASVKAHVSEAWRAEAH